VENVVNPINETHTELVQVSPRPHRTMDHPPSRSNANAFETIGRSTQHIQAFSKVELKGQIFYLHLSLMFGWSKIVLQIASDTNSTIHHTSVSLLIYTSLFHQTYGSTEIQQIKQANDD